MKQAIEEGFILDVLKNYTTFQTMFELVSKVDLPEDTPEYEKQNALRLMMQYVNQHPYVINYKANMMVDYFMQHSAQKMKGKSHCSDFQPRQRHIVPPSHHTPVEREVQWRGKSPCGIQR